MKKKLFITIFILLLVLIYSIFLILKSSQESFEVEIAKKIERKNFVLEGYLNTTKSLLFTLKDTFIKNLLIFEDKDYTHPYIKKLCLKNNGITHYTKIVLDKNIYASINGLTDHLNNETNNEIVSLLYLNPIFKNSIKYINNLLWIYYTSNNKFVYLAPTDMQTSVYFIKELYNKLFWLDAIEKKNPKKDLIITDIYLDSANKGLMTTLSLPVYLKNEFKGVFSVDIGLDTIQNIVKINDNYGKLYLIKSNNVILSLNDSSNLIEKLNYKNRTDIYYKELSTFDDKLKFVYIIDKNKKLLVSLKNASSLILISIFIFFIVTISFYLFYLTKKIRLLSYIDPLTSLLNRRAMEEKMNTLLVISQRYEQDISFLMLDLDDFKKVNDTYGHQAGDKILVAVSNILTKNCRKADLISRYGGEEFLICLANTEIHKAYKLAERIRLDISKLKIEDIDTQITISIGCTEHIFDEHIEKTIARADKLLYEAKTNGKNQTLTGVRF